MPFILKDAQDCQIDLGQFTRQYMKEQFVHLTLNDSYLIKGNQALKILFKEFGSHSQNYAYSYRESAPKAYAQPKTGSGLHPVSDHVAPYLLDKDTGRFTTSEENSIIGGMFINRNDIEIITNYIEQAFPRANIENNINSSSYRP